MNDMFPVKSGIWWIFFIAAFFIGFLERVLTVFNGPLAEQLRATAVINNPLAADLGLLSVSSLAVVGLLFLKPNK